MKHIGKIDATKRVPSAPGTGRYSTAALHYELPHRYQVVPPLSKQVFWIVPLREVRNDLLFQIPNAQDETS
jgi:hypothetical protein